MITLGATLALALASAAAAQEPALEQLRAAAGTTPAPVVLPAQGRTTYFCALGAQGEGVNGFMPLRLPGADSFASRDKASSGIPVVDDGTVTPAARSRARALVDEMLAQSPAALRKRLRRNHVFVVIIPQDKKLTDLKPFEKLRGVLLPDGRTWDDIRGVGFFEQPDGRVAVGIGEENLLAAPARRDGYPKGYLMAHEFAHAVHGYGVAETVSDRLWTLYAARRQAGLDFPSRYASTNEWEYWAVSANIYFRLRLGGGDPEKDWEWLGSDDAPLFSSLAGAFGRTRPLWPASPLLDMRTRPLYPIIELRPLSSMDRAPAF